MQANSVSSSAKASLEVIDLTSTADSPVKTSPKGEIIDLRSPPIKAKRCAKLPKVPGKEKKKTIQTVQPCPKCGSPLYQGTSKKPKSFGKEFFKCDTCKFFRWKDDMVLIA